MARCAVRAAYSAAQRPFQGAYRGWTRSARFTGGDLAARGPYLGLAIVKLFYIVEGMEILRRKTLPHQIPSWVDPHNQIYFITINCEERFRNQLALPPVSQALLETVRHREEQFLWWPHLFLLMPDHLHALLSFPPSSKSVQKIVSKWKEWTAKELGIAWQRDFFEHRLRQEESRRQKADYILQNPVRQNLVVRPEDWPFVYFANGQRPDFNW
jgi:REP element-mobilizing transposase RayT